MALLRPPDVMQHALCVCVCVCFRAATALSGPRRANLRRVAETLHINSSSCPREKALFVCCASCSPAKYQSREVSTVCPYFERLAEL